MDHEELSVAQWFDRDKIIIRTPAAALPANDDGLLRRQERAKVIFFSMFQLILSQFFRIFRLTFFSPIFYHLYKEMGFVSIFQPYGSSELLVSFLSMISYKYILLSSEYLLLSDA